MRVASLGVLIPIMLSAHALLVSGCRRPPAKLEVDDEPQADDAEPPAATEPDKRGGIPTTDQLACTPTLHEDGELRIADQPTGVEAYPDQLRVRAFPWDDTSILLGLGKSRPAWYEEPDQRGTLYRVRCAQPQVWEPLLKVEDADFAWAELSPDRRWLYFTYPGVGVLDFVAGDWAVLGPPRMLEQCWLLEQPIAAEDYVVGWAPSGGLLIDSGGPCGFEAEWQGGAQVLDDVKEDRVGSRRARGHIGDLQSDAKARVWVGDGGLCEEPETVMTQGHGGVWRSADLGESWAFLPITALKDHGVRRVFINDADPRHVLALAECCYESAADFCSGGELFASDDDGATWREISPALSQPDPDLWGPVFGIRVDEAAWIITALVSFDGDPVALESHDGGQTWKPSAVDVDSLMLPKPQAIEIQGRTFEPSPDGLIRSGEGEPDHVILRPGVDPIGK